MAVRKKNSPKNVPSENFQLKTFPPKNYPPKNFPSKKQIGGKTNPVEDRLSDDQGTPVKKKQKNV